MQVIDDLWQSINLYWGYSIGLAATFYGMMIFLGKHLSEDANAGLTLWLKGDFESTWSENFCKLFDVFFGEKHLSWKCFFRSAIASVIAVGLLYFLYTSVLGVLGVKGSRAQGDYSFVQLILFGAAINIIPDYLSLFETRWLLKRFEKVQSFWGQLAVLIVDLIFSGAIIWLGINAFELAQVIWGKGHGTFEAITVVEMFALFSLYSIFFYSTFLTSVWAWIYCLSSWFMRIFSRSPLKVILNVDKKPTTQIALVGSALLLAVALALSPILKTKKGQQITALDEALCKLFPDDICAHLASMTVDEYRAMVFFSEACMGRPTDYCVNTVVKYYKGNKAKAINVFDKSCKQNHPTGCSNLAFMYNTGEGVIQDYGKALEFFKLACRIGSNESCASIGTMYEKGHGVEQDLFQARLMYEAVCDGGTFPACNKLGLMYLNGFGGIQDYPKAYSLFEMSCSNGLKEGCLNVKVMWEKDQIKSNDLKKIEP